MPSNKIVYLSLALLTGICNFLYITYFISQYNYLPAPFISDKNDTFMDFFNTLCWSQSDGIYTVWKSIYPPLNFLLLDFFYESYTDNLIGCSLEYREQLLSKLPGIIIIFVSCLLISIKISYGKLLNLKYQIILFSIFLLSPPFLFSLERGNLLIICLPLLSLYIYYSNNLHKAFILSLLINIKPYFLILYIITFLNLKVNNENNDLIFLTPILSLIIFLLTGLILNQEFYFLPFNLLGFSSSDSTLNPQHVLGIPSTISSFFLFKEIIPEFGYSMVFAIPLKVLLFYYLYKLMKLLTKIKLDQDYLTVIGVIFITNYSITSGGYSLIFYVPILAILFKKNIYYFIPLIGIFFLGIISLIPIYTIEVKMHGISFFSTETIEIMQNLTLSSVIYPIVNFTILIMFYKYLSEKLHGNLSIKN
jgi:hypothetical protein